MRTHLLQILPKGYPFLHAKEDVKTISSVVEKRVSNFQGLSYISSRCMNNTI